jgi:hypothetical protein
MSGLRGSPPESAEMSIFFVHIYASYSILIHGLRTLSTITAQPLPWS